MQGLNLIERLHSHRNQVFLKLRDSVRFSRGRYSEEGCGNAVIEEHLAFLSPQARAEWEYVEKKYEFRKFAPWLSLPVYEKNILTLWILEKFSPSFPKTVHTILEPGCQDFNRAPAIAAFFRRYGLRELHGLELDPYPVLDTLHSRLDKARYYKNVATYADLRCTYAGGDFFKHQGQYDMILCFYPFVSPHPALAWGLPASFGRPEPWILALNRCLSPGKIALIVHQGEWEEEDFDDIRAKTPNSLEISAREILLSAFTESRFAPHASVYINAKI